MCGIAGLIGNKEKISRERLTALSFSMAHRGPDDEGIEIMAIPYSTDVLGLVHRRLSIVDLSSAGHQPMKDSETGNSIVFNGEIYNYKELRQELEQRGYAFASHTDTEVILKAYACYGESCLEKFRGMFAFGLFDAKKQKIFLAVDRFGIKPLYFYASREVFAFSSEVRAFLRANIVPRSLEPRAVESYLAYGAVQAPLTMIKEVEMLLPAQLAVYDCKTHQMSKRIYGRPEEISKDTETPLNEILLDSVRHHLIADVPIALFLSGGIDSSALAILVNKVAGRTLDSFSITFGESKYAEGQYARMIGERFCARHHEIQLSESDLHQLLPQALNAMDQPTVDGINVYVISKAVHDAGIKVVLSGQGGDEVFGGYSTFKRMSVIQKFYHALYPLKPLHPGIGLFIRSFDHIRGRSSSIESKLSQFFESDGTVLSTYLILRQLFGPRARKHLLGNHVFPNLFNGLLLEVTQDLQKSLATLDIFNANSLLELRLYLANTLLRDCDVMSMAHGLEVRVPYLDPYLLQQVWNIPTQEKMDNQLPKPLLLKQVIEKMPEEIYKRPKMGFTFPWEVWLRGDLRQEVQRVFSDSRAYQVIGFRPDACRVLWKEFLLHKKGISWARVWALYVLLSWVDRNIMH